MNVFTFDPSAKHEKERKEQLLEVLNAIRKQVEDGDIKEFVRCH